MCIAIVVQGVIGGFSILSVKMGWLAACTVLHLALFAFVGLECAKAKASSKHDHHGHQ